jgi:hypothetical protein
MICVTWLLQPLLVVTLNTIVYAPEDDGTNVITGLFPPVGDPLIVHA